MSPIFFIYFQVQKPFVTELLPFHDPIHLHQERGCNLVVAIEKKDRFFPIFVPKLHCHLEMEQNRYKLDFVKDFIKHLLPSPVVQEDLGLELAWQGCPHIWGGTGKSCHQVHTRCHGSYWFENAKIKFREAANKKYPVGWFFLLLQCLSPFVTELLLPFYSGDREKKFDCFQSLEITFEVIIMLIRNNS